MTMHALFAAAFSPPHMTHLHMIDTVLVHTAVEHIIVLPAGEAYRKSGLLCARDRLALLGLMLKDHGDATTVSLVDVERPDHPSSIVSARDCRRRHGVHGEMPWILGTDRLRWLACQDQLDEIVDEFPLIVFERHELRMDDISNHPAVRRAMRRSTVFPVPDRDTSSRVVRRSDEFSGTARMLGITWRFVEPDSASCAAEIAQQEATSARLTESTRRDR